MGSVASEYIYPREAFSQVREVLDSPPDVRERFFRIIDTVFFASLLAEEGEYVPIGLVWEVEERLEDVLDTDPLVAPIDSRSWFVCRIDPIPFEPKNLKNFAHGIEYGRDVAVVTSTRESIEITGIARRRRASSGGNVLRVAAPRPGVLVLEGRNRQLGIRYETGLAHPNDVNVFDEDGPAREAIRACMLEEHCWSLYEVLRHARATKAGGMFLCVPTSEDVERFANVPYRFQDSSSLTRLAGEERRLLRERVASAPVAGHVEHDEIEARAMVEHEWAEVREDLDALVEMVGRLAANDGAVLVGPGCNFIGAGMIVDDLGATTLPPPIHCSDAAGTIQSARPTGGGARHNAGFRFAWSVPGSVVFIVSADGSVTCAIRHVESLLTWPVRLSET